MPVNALGRQDLAKLALADVGAVRGALAYLGTRPVPPWLRPGHPVIDGSLPKDEAAFAAVSDADLLEIIAVRGPLHAIDGWAYIGRALNAIISGDAHTARHLAYYAELRGALSILASSGIGIFDRRNIVIDVAGMAHSMTKRGTHDMCWATILQWAKSRNSLERMVTPISIAGVSLLDPVREFFPGASSAGAAHLMREWGFDLEQGAQDRDERNWSSYQPTALRSIMTTPADDLEFLSMFWKALRPGGYSLERHLLRILLEVEMRSLNETSLTNFTRCYERVDDRVQTAVPFDFLTRTAEPLDHTFITYAQTRTLPAHPYAMLCRGALMLRIATGMAEANLLATGMQPVAHFDGWWRQFGVQHGFWSPTRPPADSQDLWHDIQVALDDAATAPVAHRHEWTAGLAGSAFRLCEAERAALWGLFR